MSSSHLKLDYVSPLPPVRSGIADYTADLLPHLAARCDLRLIELPGQDVSPEIRRAYPLVSADRLGEDGRLPLYQMGNNHHHEAVYELAMAQPGILTLHDIVLHHFLLDRTVNRGELDLYRRMISEEHGWIGEAVAGPLHWPGGVGTAMQFALTAHRGLLTAQRAVLVHSGWAVDSLREEIPELAVRAIPMGVPLPDKPLAELGKDFRRRRGLPEDRPVLGSFGFQTPMKRTDVVISALALPPLADVHLMVAGEIAPALELEEEARRAGVADRVHFLGFLPFAELEAAIAAADVCLNLRYPTAGETSASLLRILAIGRAAVVSDFGPSAELPDEVVVKVPLGEGEKEILADRLAALLNDPGALARLGEKAREHVRREHAPARAAEALVAACRAFEDASPPGNAVVGTPPPTSLTWDRMHGELEVEGAERPWREGRRRRLAIRLKNRSAARWLAAERPGGLAIEIQLLAGGRNLRRASDWIGLPADLEPDDEHVFHFDLRRPLGDDVELRILPHVLGTDKSFAHLDGPVWSAEI